MQPLKAVVKNGRLVLDEPTDRPEGDVVELRLVEADEVLDRDDGLDDEERAALHRSIRRSIAQSRTGQLVDADEAMARLRSRK